MNSALLVELMRLIILIIANLHYPGAGFSEALYLNLLAFPIVAGDDVFFMSTF